LYGFQEKENRMLDRRDFLRTGAAATAAALAGPRLARAADGPTVAIVRDKTKSVIKGRTVDAAIAQKLVDQAVMAVAGKDDVAKAWAAFVSPKDKVAVKFNGLFRDATTHPEVVIAVCKGMIAAGVKPENILVYDRDQRAFNTAGFKEGVGGTNAVVKPTEQNFGKATDASYAPGVKAGPVDTRLAKVLAEEATVLVNVPMLKSHRLAGMSGALKNHLGSVPNPRDFHRDGCRYVGDINALPPIKDKTRICICDALAGNYDRGPQYSPRHRWDYCGIIACTDSVALDTILGDVIRAKRVEAGMSPFLRPHLHVERAAELGLGCADLKKIQKVEQSI
jgi:uncharacterized protein (DUF362 family)